jgi:hypothetical protein
MDKRTWGAGLTALFVGPHGIWFRHVFGPLRPPVPKALIGRIYPLAIERGERLHESI